MPVPAFVPLIMVWVGIEESAKITVIFIGTFFQLVLMVADDALAVPDDQCRVYVRFKHSKDDL